MMTWKPAGSAALVFLLGSATFLPGNAQTPATPKYTITDLGTLGGSSSDGRAINAAGQVTGVSETAGHDQHAFRSDATAMTDLGTLGGSWSYGRAINAAGQVTGVSETAVHNQHAFRSDGATMTDLGTFESGSTSDAVAINDAGQVTGSSDIFDGITQVEHAFLSDGTTMIDLGTLGGSFSVGVAINAAGQVTGWASLAGDAEQHAFRSDGTTMIDLGTLGGIGSFGHAINASGQVTGSALLPDNNADTAHAFRSDGTTMTDLGTLDGSSSVGFAINASGQVTGVAYVAGNYHAFLADGTTMTDLGTLGGTLSQGNAINAGGQVTGWSLSADGSSHGFVFVPGRGMLDLNDLIPSGSSWTLLWGNAMNDKGQITGGGWINGQLHAFLLTPVPTTLYTFTGFLPPIDNLPTVNFVKSGAAVPVKFSLGGDHGLDIFTTGYPRSQAMICGAGLLDDIEQTATKGGSKLRYDPAARQYIYTWATDKQWGGTCRQLQIGLADGQVFKANFQFR
jgi:probable HAF family extracellular repeat protein